MTMLAEQVQAAVDFLSPQMPSADVGLVLGTGLGPLADQVQDSVRIPYADIPHFPESTVKFHAGQLVYGRLGDKTVLAMQGRFHYYEGHGMRAITLPVRVMQGLGIEKLILTNAAGSVREELPAGSLAVIRDHINLMGDNPLIGPADERLGTRFPDMSEPYDAEFRRLARQKAEALGIQLPETVYAAISGPSFETKAEIRMLQILGIDTIGMSVIPEVLVARQLTMRVLGITAVTDQALPGSMQPVSHIEVARVAQDIAPKFQALMQDIIKAI